MRWCPFCARTRPIELEAVEPFEVERCAWCGFVHAVGEGTHWIWYAELSPGARALEEAPPAGRVS
jgi:NMD protein affecting ribosome stability and mRNA decay